MLGFPNPAILAGGAGGEPVGQAIFLYSQAFVVPAGVTKVCGVAISAGAAGGDFGEPGGWDGRSGEGGCLRYLNDIPVTPGEILTVDFGFLSLGTRITLLRGATPLLRAPRVYEGDGVGIGFDGGNWAQTGGGQTVSGAGAGGYTGPGENGSAGGNLAGGGGSSLYGGGLGGRQGAASGVDGESYGGGGAVWSREGVIGRGGPGGLRLIWGPGRAFPNTNTGDMSA